MAKHASIFLITSLLTVLWGFLNQTVACPRLIFRSRFVFSWTRTCCNATKYGHKVTHKNIWGKNSKGRWVEEAIGIASSVPTGINFSSHRASHMRHHAYTNVPERNPDHFTDGKLSELPKKFYGITMLYSSLSTSSALSVESVVARTFS